MSELGGLESEKAYGLEDFDRELSEFKEELAARYRRQLEEARAAGEDLFAKTTEDSLRNAEGNTEWIRKEFLGNFDANWPGGIYRGLVEQRANRGSMSVEEHQRIQRKQQLFSDIDRVIETLGLDLARDEDTLKLFMELRRLGYEAAELR